MTSGSWLRMLTAAFVVAAALSLPAGDALARGGVYVRPGHRFDGHHGLRHHGHFGFHDFHAFHRRPFQHHDRFFHGPFHHTHPFHHHGFYEGLRRPVPLPYGTRFYYPSGIPLSYYDSESSTTYCLSLRAGFYYVCGYSHPAHEPVEPAYLMPAGTVSPRGEQGLPPPSGVLLFELRPEAEATVNGVPVRLSLGHGIAAVPPGRYRVVVRASGTETEHTITVDSHTILTVTPTSVVPADP